MYSVLVFILLMVNWVIFSGLLDAFHLTLGIISCFIVTRLSADLVFENRAMSMGQRLVQAWRLAGYLLWLFWQVILANAHVLKLALTLRGGEEIKPRMVRFQSKLKTGFGKFALANSITLTPGTVTVRIDGDIFVIHAISRFAAEGLDGDMEARVARVFEPDNLEALGKGAQAA